MKEGWEYKKLGEVCEKAKNIKWEEHPNQQYKYIDLSAVDRLKHRVLSTVSINSTNAPSRAKQIVKDGDVLFATTRPTLKRLVIVDKSLHEQICSTGFCVLRPNKEKIESSWLYYILSDQSFYNYIEPLQKGASYPAVTDMQVKSYLIPIPPLSEQHRIVSYLDAAFAKIDAVAKNAEDALKEAKALFQSALTKMMEPKEGWEEKTLLEIGKTQTGTTPSKSNSAFYGDYMPFIRPSEINYDGLGNLNYNSEIKLSKEGSESGRVFKTGSILMVCIGATISKVGYNEQDVSCNQQINVITPYDGFNYKFIYYAMTAPKFKAKVINEGTSSQATLPIINKRKWEQLSLAFPPIDEQINIVDKLEIMHQKICNMSSNLTRTLSECSALKQAILRQTFE